MAIPRAFDLVEFTHQIAEREAELTRLQSLLGKVNLSAEDSLAALNVLAMLEHELVHWKALRDNRLGPAPFAP
jgi:hypothetical protein